MLAQEVISAQESERHSLARELHDESGQIVTSIIIQVGLLEQSLEEETLDLRYELNQINEYLQELMENLRRIAHGLRPAALDTFGFEAALKNLIISFCEQAHLELDFQASPIPEVEDYIAVSLYRLAQEALTNVVKHSQAGKVTVNLGYNDPLVYLNISDDGVGFNRAELRETGIGLSGMAERLDLVQGLLEIESQPGKGTQIKARVPVKEIM